MVMWTVGLGASDEPSQDQCTRYANAMANKDLTTVMMVASEFYNQQLNLDSQSSGYRSLRLLSMHADLRAERFDSHCLGWKFFSYYDSLVVSEAPVFSD